MHTYTHTHVHTCTHIHICTPIHVHVCIHTHTYVHTCIHAHIHMCAPIHVHTHTCMCACMCACVHTCIHARTYTHTHAHSVPAEPCTSPRCCLLGREDGSAIRKKRGTGEKENFRFGAEHVSAGCGGTTKRTWTVRKDGGVVGAGAQDRRRWLGR